MTLSDTGTGIEDKDIPTLPQKASETTFQLGSRSYKQLSPELLPLPSSRVLQPYRNVRVVLPPRTITNQYNTKKANKRTPESGEVLIVSLLTFPFVLRARQGCNRKAGEVSKCFILFNTRYGYTVLSHIIHNI